MQTVKILDPRVKINNQRRYAVLKGGSQCTYQTFTAPSATTNSIQYTANPPNAQTIVNRKVYQKWFCQFDFTGVNNNIATQNLLVPGLNDGLRCHPISSVLQTVQATINNNQLTSNLNNYFQPFLHYYNGQFQQDYDLSMSPSQLDQTQNYEDYLAGSGYAAASGTARNVLAYYGENSTQQSRGAFPVQYPAAFNVLGAASGRALATITEPIFLSPYTWGMGDHSGFIGVQTMLLNFQTGYGTAGLGYMWSHAMVPGGNTLSSIAVTFTANPQLLFEFISPDPIEPIPSMISYPYYNIVTYQQSNNTLAAWNPATQDVYSRPSTTATFSNIQLENIPNRIYVWAKEDQNNARAVDTVSGYISTDTFANITNVNITFNNKSSILASASEQDLYQIAIKNGLCGSWSQWKTFQGSVLALNPSEDFGLPSEDANGSLGTRNLVVQCTFNNPNPARSINYTLWVAIVTEGVMTIANQQVVTSTAVLTAQDVLSSQEIAGFDYSQMKITDKLAGAGNFFSDIWSGIQSVLPIAKPIIGALKPFMPGMVRTAADAVGLGLGAKKKRSRRGGAILSRNDLANRLDEY